MDNFNNVQIPKALPEWATTTYGTDVFPRTASTPPTPSTPTTQDILAQSTAAAQKAASMIGGSFTQGVGFSPTVPTSADQIKPTSTVNLPTKQPPSGDISDASSKIAGYSATLKELEKRAKDLQAEVASFQPEKPTGISSILSSFSGKQADTAATRAQLEAQSGVQSIRDYMGQLSVRQAELQTKTDEYNSVQEQVETQIANLYGQGGGMPLDFLNNQAEEIRRRASPKLNRLSNQINSQIARMEMEQGNFEVAQQYIDKAVADKVADQKFNLDLFNTFLDTYENEISRLDKKQQEALQQARWQAEFDYQKSYDAAKLEWEREKEKMSGVVPGTTPGLLSGVTQSVIENPALFWAYTPTQRSQITNELISGGYDVSGLRNVSLTPAQKEDMAQMSTVNSLIGNILSLKTEDGSLPGVGAFGVGSLKGIAAQVGLGSEEGQKVRSLIGNITGTIAKLRGGTSFTTNEQKLLETYVPKVNDSSGVILTKLALLSSFIEQKNKDLVSTSKTNITEGLQKAGTIPTAEDLRTKYNY